MSQTPVLTSKAKLKCVCLNANSIVNKRCQMASIIEEDKTDIVLISEAHLNDDIKSCEIFSSNFTVFRKDPNRKGGGVLLAARPGIAISHRPDLETECELLWL